MPLDYSRIDELDEAHFPFLKEPIATADGLVLSVDKGIRRQLMSAPARRTSRSSPDTTSARSRPDFFVTPPAGFV